VTTEALARPEVQQALGRAAVYQLLSLAFAYPDEEGLDELRSYVTDVSEHAIADEDGLRAPLEALGRALRRSDTDEPAGEHNRLFAGEVVCSAHETEYAFDPFAKSRQLADIAGFYRAFGLEVSSDRRGLPDHLATELEFLSLLVRKQVYAAAQGWVEQRDVAGSAVASFLADHLGRWAPVLCEQVRAEGRDAQGFYAAAAGLLEGFLRRELARAGARPVPVRSRIRSGEDDAAFACPLADGASGAMASPD
jgi:putative dimethyl sulfoxide reductase chaperone